MIPKHGEPHKTWDPYECERFCQGADGSWKDKIRETYRCSRLDLEPVEWVPLERVVGKIRTLYQGRARDRKFGHRWTIPPEDPDGGCPGGWARSRFLASVLAYYRKRTEGGGRVPNRLYNTCDDPIILAAIEYLEHEEERSVGYQYKRINEKREAG